MTKSLTGRIRIARLVIWLSAAFGVGVLGGCSEKPTWSAFQQVPSFEAAAHEQNMAHNAEAGEQDLKLQKAQAAIKPKGGSDAE